MAKHKKYGIYEKCFKRLLDFCCALIAIVILSPLMLVIAILVRTKLGSPIIFKQKRPGKNEKIFTLYKFRTMTNKRDVNGELLSDKERLTEFGRFLRSTSLDELPELFNVLIGDMSIIGPRPLLPEYLPFYTCEEKHRHDVRPGISGLAQVNGRNFISWEEIFAYDIEYVNQITFKRDVSIVINTIKKVLKRDDIVDLSEVWKDSTGKLHCTVDGKDVLINGPLNIERADLYRK